MKLIFVRKLNRPKAIENELFLYGGIFSEHETAEQIQLVVLKSATATRNARALVNSYNLTPCKMQTLSASSRSTSGNSDISCKNKKTYTRKLRNNLTEGAKERVRSSELLLRGLRRNFRFY